MHPLAVCCTGPQRLPACALCPVSGGLMRRTTCGRWVHAACALWTPGMWINADSGLVEGLAKLPKVDTSLWDEYGVSYQHLVSGVPSLYICLTSQSHGKLIHGNLKMGILLVADHYVCTAQT